MDNTSRCNGTLEVSRDTGSKASIQLPLRSLAHLNRLPGGYTSLPWDSLSFHLCSSKKSVHPRPRFHVLLLDRLRLSKDPCKTDPRQAPLGRLRALQLFPSLDNPSEAYVSPPKAGDPLLVRTPLHVSGRRGFHEG